MKKHLIIAIALAVPATTAAQTVTAEGYGYGGNTGLATYDKAALAYDRSGDPFDHTEYGYTDLGQAYGVAQFQQDIGGAVPVRVNAEGISFGPTVVEGDDWSISYRKLGTVAGIKGKCLDSLDTNETLYAYDLVIAAAGETLSLPDPITPNTVIYHGDLQFHLNTQLGDGDGVNHLEFSVIALQVIGPAENFTVGSSLVRVECDGLPVTLQSFSVD